MPDDFVTWTRQRGALRLEVESAEGAEFVLPGGRRLFDFVSTSFQANFGHRHPLIVEAIARQVREMGIALPKADYELKRRAGRRLLELLGLPGRIFYTVSGSESVENALKIARRVTGRNRVLARRKSYHGASLGALSVTGDWRREGYLTLEDYTIRIPEPMDDPDGLETARLVEAAGPESIAALIAETVTGTNGVYIPPDSWLAAMRQLCDRHGILLIADEVLCGFGRCGAPFAFQRLGLKPDLVCMSKGISGGYVPFGAVWVAERVAGFFDEQVLSAGLTSYAHPLGLAAMDAVLEIMSDRPFQANLAAICELFGERTDRMVERCGASEVRRLGMLAAVCFAGRTVPAWDHLAGFGVYTFSRGDTLFLAPPLTVEPQRLGQAFDDLERGLHHCWGTGAAGRDAGRTVVAPSVSG